MNEIKKLEHFNIHIIVMKELLDCNKNTLLYHDLWRELTKKNERESIICIEKRSKRTLKTIKMSCK